MEVLKVVEKMFLEIKQKLNLKGDVIFTPPKGRSDLSTNFAFIASKNNRENPMDIAKKITSLFDKKIIKNYEIVKPGFININLENEIFELLLKKIIEEGNDFGKGNEGKKINVEYVSANPTGYLHVGHARNAVFGAAYSRILRFLGNDVTEEYYINDFGNQIEKLGISVYVRYMNLFNKDLKLPEDSYKGKDIIHCAKFIKDKYLDKYLDDEFTNVKEEIKKIAKKFFLTKIKKHLLKLGVKMDKYYSETKVINGTIFKETLEKIKDNTYKKDGALWLETKKLGDDKDRVLIKKNGVATYFAPDLAYHNLKISRKDEEIIDVWGIDHLSYMERMKYGVSFLNSENKDFKIISVEMVRLIKNNQELKMSKRLGTAFTIDELVDSIGKDTANFYLLNRSLNSLLDFNIDAAKEKSNKNFAFFIQYSFARMNQIIIKSKYKKENHYKFLDYKIIKDALLLLNEFPSILLKIRKKYKINLLCEYLINVAKKFNTLYEKNKIIDSENEKFLITLTKAFKVVLKNGLKLIGVDQLKKI